MVFELLGSYRLLLCLGDEGLKLGFLCLKFEDFLALSL